MQHPSVLDLKRLRRYSLSERPSKVEKSSFAKVTPAGSSFRTFTQNLPRILAAQSFERLVEAIVAARKNRKPVITLMGAHVLKVGLSPLIVDWIEQRVVTAIAMTGSGIIHDFELAYQGQTSEEVAEALADGSFGMARETADFLNGAIQEGAKKGSGLGESVGRLIEMKKFRFRKLSVFAAAYRMKIPATVHVAIGTDIIHQHPSCDGAALGKASLADFHILAQAVSGLGSGGVVINIGSAVVLPEVFPALLTGFALAFARSLGEYGSVIFIAGNMPMKTEITPLLIMIKLEQFDYAGATAIALVFLVVSFALLLAVNLLQSRLTAGRAEKA